MRYGSRGTRIPKRKKSENWPMATVRMMKLGWERRWCFFSVDRGGAGDSMAVAVK